MKNADSVSFTGTPLLKFKFDSIYLIMLLTILLNVCSIAYSVILLSTASNIKSNLGNFLNMVTNDGYFLPLILSLPAILIIIVDVTSISFVVKVIYSKDRNMGLNQILFIIVILCGLSAIASFVFSVIALSHSHSSHEKLHDGIKDAMINYGLDSTVKVKLDLMQILFQCCGSKSYTEWYEISWFDANFIDNTTKLFGGEVPFSCCSMHTIYPCIHHGIENTKSVYFYNPETNMSISTHGCHEVLVKQKMNTSWSMFGFLFVSFTLQILIACAMRIIQTAHYQFGKIEDGRHEFSAWLINLQFKKPAVKRPVIDEVDESFEEKE